MTRALYRKYRSASLDEIVGQQHITSILKRAIESDRVSHAYLLTGPRGVGKTSVARILAYEINGLPYDNESTHLDIIEIDAASNNGVEDVRDLREKVQIAPVSAKKKIYIIDEVHMLSKAAFNALLKTLEEPPAHVVFILATTDADKLPDTIVSRTQRFGFRSISPEDTTQHLRMIADKEKITITDEALSLIAERGDGSFRDSISLLDQLSSLADEKTGITAELVEASLGLAPKTLINDLLAAVDAHDIGSLSGLLESAKNDGISAVVIASQLVQHLRGLVVKRPQLLQLIDRLLDVTKSSHPDLKLLSILGTFAHDVKPPKSVALAAPVLEVSASVESLSRPIKHVPAEAPVKTSPKSDSSPKTKQPDETPAPIKQKKKGSGNTKDFNWKALVDYTKEHYVALYSVLSKCKSELEDGTLTLFTINNFYKKKIDDPKYSSHLYASLEALGYELSIHTVPTSPAPKSSQAASVAAIMGGGEEVALDAS